MKNNLLFLIAVCIISCNEKDGVEEDTTLPIVTITSPTNNQVFSSGQTVSINAGITDNKMLNVVHLEIINLASGAFIVHDHYSPAAASYTLSKTFTAQVSASYKIKVEAHDENDNIAKTEIFVSSN